MVLTHTNSVYSEDIVLMGNVTYPQYVHRVHDGGMAVKQGIKLMPIELVNYALKGSHGAQTGTYEFIRTLTESPAKVGFILAAGNTSWTGQLTNMVRSAEYPTHKISVMTSTQICAGHIANQIGSFDYLTTDSTSCISGHSAWYTAQNMLKLGILDAVVVVSADNGVSEDYLSIFGEHKLSKLVDEEDSDIVKFRLGQGCNISVFERDTTYTPLAIIKDMCVTAEHHNSALGIAPTGEGYTKAIESVNTVGINFIKTHSTFSLDNQVEADVIKERFNDIRTINYKLRIGHTMGASTAIETALAIQEESGTFLSLGAGMGNVFSSAVVEIL